MAKCRHRKHILLASANDVEFVPDQEPFESGNIEDSGIEAIRVDLNLHYCKRCQVVVDVEAETDIDVSEK